MADAMTDDVTDDNWSISDLAGRFGLPTHVLRHWESIGLLEDIKAHDNGLLDAIADGTFGLMKRPADKGRGLEGVARKAADYYNPATEILEEK